jgi:hypothetical protein
MDRLTVKSSTIFISAGDKTTVYRSLDEVPPHLRKKLQESTNGLNAATILIADRKGREEIVKALNGLPSELRNRLAPSLAPDRRSRGLDWKTWLEILLPTAVGLAIWLAFNYH